MAEHGVLLVPGAAAGPVVCCDEGLSFWGGVDPDTGRIIDAHHPNHGQDLAGRVVLMPSSRGSCSGSGVLLQLARAGVAPAALVFRDEENILTLGAMIAATLFDAPVPVVRLSGDVYDRLSRAMSAQLAGDRLTFDGQEFCLKVPRVEDLDLSAADRAMLSGAEGPAVAIAMEVLCLIAAAQAARGFVDVSCAHIDGCILAHDANLDFAEKMFEMGARVRIPTTINAISVDRENWQTQGVPPVFGSKASRLADAYVKMGARATFTCAPYLLEDAPKQDEAIGWSESNAVIYANSVLGARTVKHPDYLDLFIAMTGRAPQTGVYLDEHRRPGVVIDVDVLDAQDDAFWPMLGWLSGMKSPGAVPVLTGLEGIDASADDLKALCAAFGTTSAAPLIHVRGHTPEGRLEPLDHADHLSITRGELSDVWRQFNAGDASVDLVAIGSPHASLSECECLADLLDAQSVQAQVPIIVTLGRDVMAKAKASGVLDRLSQAGVQVIPDLCWCSITEPVFPVGTKTLMTNSGKYAHYADGLTGCGVRFGSLRDCVDAAMTGRVREDLPGWLS